ncbi:putative phage-related protein [Lapidilactobacillus dextrinicus DSM 20335]|uniref:Putative phage-related protein n=1 Tax=Lapidilactobacillus dextrinicus DSM 20335 TaxID=1423738 RepID=A0A0R2BJD7_9LACO|nr:hypothetical protein [Lapidilactobacillus dextrinicus]KRM79415.1 putative phage-related protein [Lapidilactobacillus dextrinicus DSM 20335]QFG46752.1 phage tail protein [Lapidilactobacillus dextrinicus]
MTLKSKYEYGIEFDGQRSNDFGLDVLDKVIGMPAKQKAVQPLPFTSNVIDLSGLYGGQVYNERTIKIVFYVHEFNNMSKDHLYTMWTKAVNWLMNSTHKTKLKDDVMNNYYYLGEVQKEPNWTEFQMFGKLEVEFTCYPFRISELVEGNDIWDDFNFELAIAQNTDYEISGSKTITLFNVGTNSVAPQLISTAPFTITMNNNTFTLEAGTYNSPDFTLMTGENKLTVTGTGKLSFVWHKELI